MSMTDTTKPRYWIAVNGTGCAMSQLPWVDPITSPVAEQMWGFPTVEEALKAQKILLTKPMPEVMAYLQNLGPDIQSGRVAYKRPTNPEPQTRGRTAWMEEAEAALVDPALVRAHVEEMDEALGPPAILPGLPGGPAIN